ncbi:hypothetical protein ACQEUU_20225 [Nonomuraea sp. CA-218870]|uniref:hypothetical protein n=1 Tax=Nonomuraea sp. CA-218870 TaxID=3239998 RepID=UPI003D915FB7
MIFAELWETEGFRVPELGELAPELRDQLAAYTAAIVRGVPARTGGTARPAVRAAGLTWSALHFVASAP